MPHRRFVGADAHFKQSFDDFEQALQHFGRSEILLHFLFAETVASFFQLFTDVRPVPRLRVLELQVLRCKLAHVRQVFFCKWARPFGKVTQECNHFFGGVSHFGGHRHLGKILVSQELCFFESELQNFLNQ